MSRNSNFFKNALFSPAVVRASGGRQKVNIGESTDSVFSTLFTSSSFKWDPLGSGLKNTQQLNVDFSKFENHTFFNSAQNKVHISIEKIINQFPFDGTLKEVETFFEKLNGYEKHVFDQFPKNKGFLLFDRTNEKTGTLLAINDYKGSGLITSNDSTEGQPVLNFNSNPFTIECAVYVPDGAVNYNEVITQRLVTGTAGYTLALSSSSGISSPTSVAPLIFIISDGARDLIVTSSLTKGTFNHIAAVYDRGVTNKTKLFVNGELKSISSGFMEADDINFAGTQKLIGSGTSHYLVSTLDFVPTHVLSGAIDEFRFFHSARTAEEIFKNKNREIYQTDDLKLYYRFNEPSGSFLKNGSGNENLCLDYSGNGLHTFITNFAISQRNTGSIVNNIMLSEEKNVSPILFPSHESVQSFTSELIASASLYDFNNPNLIVKLVPEHYLAEEMWEFDDELFGNLNNDPGMTNDRPGGNVRQQTQIISSILYLWASFFDEIKMFIDEFGRLLKVDYVDEQTINSQLLPFLAKYHSMNLPNQFSHATIQQFLEGKNITLDSAQSNRNLQDIQNTIWRRILADLPNIRKSKGTRQSLESVLRNMGIDDGNIFRIKEYGGQKRLEISDSYEKRKKKIRFLDFSGSLGDQGTLDGIGRDDNRPLLISPFLTGSRTEKGNPLPRGQFVGFSNNLTASNNENDGLFTSGSWSCEGLFNFASNNAHPLTQSLMRLHTTGTISGTQANWIIMNVIAKKPVTSIGSTGSLALYAKPDGTNAERYLKIEIPNVNIFDGNNWHVSFGRNRNESLNHVSSSYFLRTGRIQDTSLVKIQSGTAYFDDHGENALNVKSPVYNASGAFVIIGSMSCAYEGNTHTHLNQIEGANYVNFTGRATNIRFFSKNLSSNETISHINNPFSVGVEDPSSNYNFISERTGSYERLRLDYSMNQEITASDASGSLKLIDFSQNNMSGTCTGFQENTLVLKNDIIIYNQLSPKLENKKSDNKVRIHSFVSKKKADLDGVGIAPVNILPTDYIPDTDKRVAIEVSSVQSLNDDISLIFSTLDVFDNFIGDPSLVFAHDYQKLRDLRRIYFNRLKDKVSLERFFAFFKWFDDTVGDILEDLIPRSSKYMGTNFIIESHALERSKFTYMYTDMYVGDLARSDLSDWNGGGLLNPLDQNLRR